MFHYVRYSLKRRKTVNLITVGISLVLVLLLNLYFGSIDSYEKQLQDLAGNVPVSCQITNRNGSRSSGLFISEKMVDSLFHSHMTAEESCIVIMMAGEGTFSLADSPRYLNLYVVGANKAEAVDGLTEELIDMGKGSVKDFFSSDRPECIVSKETLKEHNWEIGDRILFNFYYYDSASALTKIDIRPIGLLEMEIVGTMEDLWGKTSAAVPNMILPFQTARNVYHQYNVPFYADTVTFSVKDPLRLNEFKEEMKDIGFMETAPEAMDSYMGDTLAVRDSHFITGATSLRHSMELLQSFFPVVCVLVLLIGYVVSYLSSSSRREEYVLLRLQGVKKSKDSLLFLSEQMILVLVGNMLGDLAVMLVFPNLYTMGLVNGILLFAYLIGAAAAYWRMCRMSVMGLLSTQ